MLSLIPTVYDSLAEDSLADLVDSVSWESSAMIKLILPSVCDPRDYCLLHNLVGWVSR